MQQRLEGLQAEHDYAYRSDRLAASLGIRKTLTDAQRKATPPVVQPVVRTHPVSGRKALYINPGFTVRVLGLDETESSELLTWLFNHCLRPAYRFRYQWQPGDLLLWDNAAVMHRATTRELDPSLHRHIWRTIVSGDAPF
jgi:taurine dioxygenase